MGNHNTKSYTIYGPERWERYFVEYGHQYLATKNVKVDIQRKMSFTLDITANHPNWYDVLRKNIVFQNNETKQFFAINHADQEYNIPPELLNHPLCVGLLKCQYRRGIYGDHNGKVSPFTYGVKRPDEYFPAREELQNVRRESRVLHFKGNDIKRGAYLSRLAAMHVINKDWGYKDETGAKRLMVSQKEYLSNIAKSKLALSLPGSGNLCHREIEAGGLGVPVLMPILKNEYYDALIPNVHYIAVDLSKVKTEVEFCDAIKKRYEEVIDDNTFLDTVSKNMLNWFKRNIEYPSNMELMEKILLERFNYQL